jgi:uncharacterized protein HemY
MKSLSPAHYFHVQTARCCLESGDAPAARKELEKIPAEFRAHPDVLEVRWAFEARAGEWEACLETARVLRSAAPERPTGWIKYSYTLSRLNRVKEALDALFPAAREFAQVPMVAYNLACYAAQLQHFWEAERWLKQSFELGGTDYRNMARKDKQLRAIWDRI